MPESRGTILERWEVTPEELTEVVDENPSLRGMLLGYVAEVKLRKIWLEGPGITESVKYDDHDRKKKGDRVIGYKGVSFIVECKSLQTNSIRRREGRLVGKVLCDASDRRPVKLGDGSVVNTTCLKVGEFDVLAVNLFAFEEKWRFIFARNRDLPRSGYGKYTEEQREQLLATLIEVSWPPREPFREDLFSLLDEMIQERMD